MVQRVSETSFSISNPSAIRRTREKQQRRQLILDAAERVFAIHGFHGASVDKIAAEAEYAPGTIYLYFKDKHALYSALFIGKLTGMVDEIEHAAQASSDPVHGLYNAIHAQFAFNDRNQKFFEVFTRHRTAEQTANAEEWEKVHETMLRHQRVLTKLIEKGQRKKLLRPGNSRDYASALIGSIIHMSHEMELKGKRLMKEADFVFELFIKGAQRLPQTP